MLKTFLLVFVFSAALSAQELQNVTVQPGDTLWGISNKYLKDPAKWDIILRYNKIPPNPSAALPGMSLKIPVELLKEEYRAARFVDILNDVRLRKRNKSEWGKAVKADELYNGDTLRTNSASRADIRFYTGQVLNLFANSMVVLRPPQKKDSDVQLLSGQVRSVNSRVVTASAKIVPKTKGTEFGAKVNEDLTTLVQVYKGVASVEAKGKKIDVKEGFSSEVKMDMTPSEPVKMAEIPKFESIKTVLAKNADLKIPAGKNQAGFGNFKNGKIPTAGVSIPGAGLPQNEGTAVPDSRVSTPDINKTAVDFKELFDSIKISDTVSGYRLQVAQDKDFTRIVFDRKMDLFKKIDLAESIPGGYYWLRMAPMDLLGFQGKFGDPRYVFVK